MAGRAAGPDRWIVLLRGINVGAANRIAMPALRAALCEAGLVNVRTHLQSGNIVLDTRLDEAELERLMERLIVERFGLSVPVLARGVGEWTDVVAANPLLGLAQEDPKRFQVTFLPNEPEPEAVRAAQALAAEVQEPLAVHGRALYAWHPKGVHVSKLAPKLTPKRLGVRTATARNWSTVTTLLEIARADAG